MAHGSGRALRAPLLAHRQHAATCPKQPGSVDACLALPPLAMWLPSSVYPQPKYVDVHCACPVLLPWCWSPVHSVQLCSKELNLGVECPTYMPRALGMRNGLRSLLAHCACPEFQVGMLSTGTVSRHSVPKRLAVTALGSEQPRARTPSQSPLSTAAGNTERGRRSGPSATKLFHLLLLYMRFLSVISLGFPASSQCL